MAHLHDFNISPPPPAYSEQELDQKVSLASQLSLTSHQNHVVHEDEWEAWDEAAFEEAAARLQKISLQGHNGTQGEQQAVASSSQQPASRLSAEIQPLRIHKKNPSGGGSSAPPAKPKPSWLAEAEADTPGASSSHILPPLAAPAYTPTTASEPSPASLTPSSALTNPYSSSEWGGTSPVSSLPDPHPDQDEEHSDAHSDVPPALTDESLPPPPFSSDMDRHFLDPHPAAPAVHASPAMSATLVPGPPSTRGSSPAYSPNPDTNLTSEQTPSTARPSQPQLQQYNIIPSHPQPGAAPYTMHSLPPQSMAPPATRPYPRAPSNFSSIPHRSQGLIPNRNVTALSPQTMPAPRINIDLSTAYGKRPVATVVHESHAPQVFDAAAFYNSAVSAHLGSTFPKPVLNSVDPKRQSHQPPLTTPIYSFPQAAQSMPGRYVTQSTAPAQNSYNSRPYSSTLQDPFIRSPTPTYPAGRTANPMPQMLAAANEGHCDYQPPMPSYSAGRGPTIWTEPFNTYR